MLTKSQSRLIKSLQVKKFRSEYQLFTVEGGKSVAEVVDSTFNTKMVLYSESFKNRYTKTLQHPDIEYIACDPDTISALSYMSNNEVALAVVEIPKERLLEPSTEGLILMLDKIQDPGNLGTIIRIADWYGAAAIICSPDTVDLYNPKVIASSMGSFTRIKVHYQDLQKFSTAYTGIVLGAMLDGENIHHFSFNKNTCLVMGNEANGVSPDLQIRIQQRITIPHYGSAESLNVAIATAIACDNYRRVQ